MELLNPQVPPSKSHRILRGSSSRPLNKEYISDFSVGSLAFFTRSIFHSPWRFPCRRGTRVNISTPFIPVHVTFEYSVTNYIKSTGKERRISQSIRNPWTSSMNKYPSERLFCLTIVLTVDEKWFTARIKPLQVRIIPVTDGMSEDTGRFRLESLGSAPSAKIHAFWRP